MHSILTFEKCVLAQEIIDRFLLASFFLIRVNLCRLRLTLIWVGIRPLRSQLNMLSHNWILTKRAIVQPILFAEGLRVRFTCIYPLRDRQIKRVARISVLFCLVLVLNELVDLWEFFKLLKIDFVCLTKLFRVLLIKKPSIELVHKLSVDLRHRSLFQTQGVWMARHARLVELEGAGSIFGNCGVALVGPDLFFGVEKRRLLRWLHAGNGLRWRSLHRRIWLER